MALDIKVDIDGAMRGCETVRREALPFVISLALTKVAEAGRDASRVREGEVFTLRNDWTQRRTLTKAANKGNLTAQVYTDTENRRTGAPDYMPRQDEGGVKTPSSYSVEWEGRRYLAVPSDWLKGAFRGRPIPSEMRPSHLLAFYAAEPTKRQKRFQRQLIVSGMYFFIQQAQSGALMIMMREYRAKRDTAIPVYILITKANVRGRHPVDEVVFRVVPEQFASCFDRAVIQSGANDLLRGSGVSVKV